MADLAGRWHCADAPYVGLITVTTLQMLDFRTTALAAMTSMFF